MKINLYIYKMKIVNCFLAIENIHSMPIYKMSKKREGLWSSYRRYNKAENDFKNIPIQIGI